MAEPKTREQVLEDALRDLIRNFRQTVAGGRSRIVEEAGGDETACDSVEQMLAGNPYLRNAEKALAFGAALPTPAPERPTKEQALAALEACVYRSGFHQVDSNTLRRFIEQSAAVPASEPVAWRYPIGGGRYAATTNEADARSASTDGTVEALGVIPSGVQPSDGGPDAG